MWLVTSSDTSDGANPYQQLHDEARGGWLAENWVIGTFSVLIGYMLFLFLGLGARNHVASIAGMAAGSSLMLVGLVVMKLGFDLNARISALFDRRVEGAASFDEYLRERQLAWPDDDLLDIYEEELGEVAGVDLGDLSVLTDELNDEQYEKALRAILDQAWPISEKDGWEAARKMLLGGSQAEQIIAAAVAS